jgi:hypothetical protein
MNFYTHKITGDTMNKNEWLTCYSAEELRERGFDSMVSADTTAKASKYINQQSVSVGVL